MKKSVITLISKLTIASLCLSGCSKAPAPGEGGSSSSGNSDLYEVGLEITSTMGEMIKSEEYTTLLNSADFSDITATMEYADYSSPTAVYSIKIPDTETLIKKINDNSFTDTWNNLSENLQQQIENRFNFSSIVTIMNGKQGQKKLAFAATYTASKRLKTDEDITYIYFFENGTPIAVTFSSPGYATGQFVFTENTDSLSDMEKAFEEFGCTVEKIK